MEPWKGYIIKKKKKERKKSLKVEKMEINVPKSIPSRRQRDLYKY